MKKIGTYLIAIAIAFLISGCFKGKHRVVQVVDGDTFIVRPYQVVRVIGIDAPEIDSESKKFQSDVLKYETTKEAELSAATRAKAYLTSLLLKEKVKLEHIEKLMYEDLGYGRVGRKLYYVKFKGDDLGELMLSKGIVRVWSDEFPSSEYPHPKESFYKTLQENAKTLNNGLWQSTQISEIPEQN